MLSPYRKQCAQRRVWLLTLAAVSILVSSETMAQVAQNPGSADKPNTTIPEKQHMGPVDAPNTKGGGVITPKQDVDPGMTKKPPPQNPSETPVIPPKGTPGGQPAPSPK